METKTHWKKLVNTDYIGAYSLQPKEEWILTIKEVKTEKVKGADGKEQECSVCFFTEPGVKPMILNRTNSKIITKVYQTPYIEDWPGKQIQIYADKVKAFGEVVDALKIRPFVPNKPLPLLPDSGKHYDNAVKNLKEGGSLDDIRKYYSLTDELITKLKIYANIK